MKTFATAALGAALLAATPAMAQDAPNTGFYIALGVGAASVQDVDLTYSDVGGTFNGTGARDTLVTSADTKAAADFRVGLGYDFGPVRADLQIDYSRNRVTGLTVRSLNGANVTLSAADIAQICDYTEVEDCSGSGNRISFRGPKVRQASVLANLWYDIPLGAVVTPYVGGGVGIGGFEVEEEGKARFSYQLGAGVALNLSSAVAVTADYRHRWINGATFTDSEDPGYAFRVGKLRTNIFSAGLRFTF